MESPSLKLKLIDVQQVSTKSQVCASRFFSARAVVEAALRHRWKKGAVRDSIPCHWNVGYKGACLPQPGN